jgi:perosamine synthetase
MASHLEPFYRQRFPGIALPVTEVAAAEALLLPLYADMLDSEQDSVVEALRTALA